MARALNQQAEGRSAEELCPARWPQFSTLSRTHGARSRNLGLWPLIGIGARLCATEERISSFGTCAVRGSSVLSKSGLSPCGDFSWCSFLTMLSSPFIAGPARRHRPCCHLHSSQAPPGGIDNAV